MQKSRWQSYRKYRTENHLKLKTQNWSYQKTTHSWPQHYFYHASYTRQLSWKDYANQVNLAHGSCKTSIDTSPPPKSLSLHCKQINKVKNELDGQPSSLLPCIHVSNYKTTFSPMHLVFLELDTHRPHLYFKILDENNNEVIPRTFYF